MADRNAVERFLPKVVSESGTDPMVGRLTIGVPAVASAEIPFRIPSVPWYRKLFSREPDWRLIKMPWCRVRAYVAQDDDGTVDVYLSVVNMTSRSLQINHLYLERITANGGHLNLAPPTFVPPAKEIGAHSITEVYFKLALTSPAIRQLVGTVEKGETPRSSPRLQFVLQGALAIRQGAWNHQARFTVDDATPEMRISCPSAKS